MNLACGLKMLSAKLTTKSVLQDYNKIIIHLPTYLQKTKPFDLETNVLTAVSGKGF